jgi:hypothetical protein
MDGNDPIRGNLFKDLSDIDGLKMSEDEKRKRKQSYYNNLRNKDYNTRHYRVREKRNYFTQNSNKGEGFFFNLATDAMATASIRIVREIINGTLSIADQRKNLMSERFLTIAIRTFTEKLMRADAMAKSLRCFIESGHCPDSKYHTSLLFTEATSVMVFDRVVRMLNELLNTRDELIVSKYIPALRQYSKYIR